MHLTPLESFLLASAYFCANFASPLHEFHLGRRNDTSPCEDLSATFGSDCWGTLGISDWLSNWKANTPICGGDGGECCEQTEPWTTCFLRLGHGSDGDDCSQINVQTCAYDGTLSSTLSAGDKPYYHYVMKNIYSTWIPKGSLVIC